MALPMRPKKRVIDGTLRYIPTVRRPPTADFPAGQLWEGSKKIFTLKECNAEMKRMYAEAWADVGKPQSEMTLGEFMDADLAERPRFAKTKMVYGDRIKVLKRICGDVPLAHIDVTTSRRIHALILREPNAKKPTQTYARRTQIGLWRQYCMTIGFAAERGLLNHAQQPWLPKLGKGDWPKERAQESDRLLYIELDAHDKFLATVKAATDKSGRTDLYLITWLVFDGGPRLGEVRALAPTAFEPLSNTLVINSTATEVPGGWAVGSPKSGNDRRIQLSAELGKELRAWIRSLPSESKLMFPGPRGRMHSPNNLREYWKRWAKDAGIGHISPHTGRHVAATNLLQAGVNPTVVASQMGHGIGSLNAYYSHIPASALAEAQQMRALYEDAKRSKTEGQALGDTNDGTAELGP